MGITQALYTGVTGLTVMSDSMSVVANNIANANARGFKYDRAEFGDLLSQDLTGNGNAQLGRGARLTNIRTIHTQGGLAVTDRITDLAVQGGGFFVVKNPGAETQESGGTFYTRVGAFNFNKDGFLAENQGGVLMGYASELDGSLSTKLEPVRIQTNAIPPRATEKVTLNVNLDSRVEIKEGEFDINNPRQTSDFVNTVDIFDSHGTRHSMTTYFKRVADDEGISFDWHATVDSAEVTDGEEGVKIKEIATGTVRFSPQGLLRAEDQVETDGANFSKGATPGQKVLLDFGRNITTEGGNGVGVSSSTASKSGTVFHQQDGYESGNIKTLSVKLDGKIVGYYTNGVERVLGAMALATFENTDGLRKAGFNQFYETLDSGAPRIGVPQSGTRGAVYSSTLEESNVDLAQQFVNMIMTQRGFQANSRSITTTDSMIEEVVNMKR